MKIMKLRTSYNIREIYGTYWIDVVDKETKERICYSIPLKSEDEAKDLIDEAIEKIPYCKIG